KARTRCGAGKHALFPRSSSVLAECAFVQRTREPLGRSFVHAQVERGLDKFQFHQPVSAPVICTDEIRAGIKRDGADGAQRASARFTQGVVSFDRGKHSAVLFLNAKVARLRPLQDGVAKLAVEVEQGELSFRYDRGEK